MNFHILFAVLYFAFIVIRVVFHRKARHSRGEVQFNESKLNMAIRALVGLGYIGILIIYVFYPKVLDWAVFPLSPSARWLGFGITTLSVGMIWWVQWALDVQFDTTLHHHTDQKLITHGPYRWVRHPMYTTLFLMGLGWLFLTANWFVGGALMTAIVFIVSTRVKNEEAMLIELFGDEYRHYMRRTGRYLPRLTQVRTRQEP
jgi:protein-S-isoprenylcysteine O-methyltransferase Ste14